MTCERVIFSPDELSRSTVEASESEKVIQRLNQELREAHEQANSGKHKCVELQGKRGCDHLSSFLKLDLGSGLYGYLMKD